jgi:hypothetical protein
MWGAASGSAALADGWRFGMYTYDSVLAGARSGYECLPGNYLGGNSWPFRRIDSGVRTDIETIGHPHLADGHFALMKRNGGYVETWHSDDGAATWHIVNNISDTTYVNGPWVFFCGATGYETGWTGMGGGIKNWQRIYRWLQGT